MKKRKILHALIYAVLTLGALLVFFPFYLTVVSSLKDMSDIFSNFFGLPRHIVFDNFAYVLQRPDYFIALKNSAIITGVAIVAMVRIKWILRLSLQSKQTEKKRNWSVR